MITAPQNPICSARASYLERVAERGARELNVRKPTAVWRVYNGGRAKCVLQQLNRFGLIFHVEFDVMADKRIDEIIAVSDVIEDERRA
jgi:hypothetical protein